jgi:tRNA dimethylallyltransferase
MAGIPHHLIGSIEPTYSGYDIHKFRKDALEAIQMILDRGKLPILVGGTAYYVESVIYYNNLVETERNMTGSNYYLLNLTPLETSPRSN